jgi:hypothetical protein
VTIKSTPKASLKDNKIAELEARLAKFEKGAAVEEKSTEVNQESSEEIKITPDEYIQVMSLIPFHLNLSTRERGGGKTYKFDRFGQVKRILYSDLVDIFETHPAFLEAGYFYILSPKVIRHHGLDDIYKNILTKEKIEEILVAENKNVEGCIALYQSANKSQQDIIISFMVDKLVENPDALDLNFVDRISRLSGIKIADKAKDVADSFSPEKEE